MSFYSDIVHGELFTGGTYFGAGHYLTGMVTGATYNANVLSLQRVSMTDLACVVSGTTAVLQPSEFYAYTAYTQALINASLLNVTNNTTLDVTLAKFNQAVSGTVSTTEARVVGHASFVPSFNLNAKGRSINITDTAFNRRHGNMWGLYAPGTYIAVPRLYTAPTTNTSPGSEMNNRVHCFPFFTAKPYLLMEMGQSFVTTASSETLRFAIYDGSNGVMGKLLADIGSVSTVSTGYRGVLNNLALSAGTYFACAWGSASCPNVHNYTNVVWHPLASTNNTGMLSNSSCYGFQTNAPDFNGAWPDTYTGLTVGMTGGTAPFVVLRFTGLTSYS